PWPRSAPGDPPRRSPRSPRTVFWGHHLSLQQLIRPAGHRQLVLQLDDPPASSLQLGVLDRGQSGCLTSVDLILFPPCVDRLSGQIEILGDRCHRSPGSDQVENSATELRRISPRHVRPSSTGQGTPDSNIPTPENPGNITPY